MKTIYSIIIVIFCAFNLSAQINPDIIEYADVLQGNEEPCWRTSLEAVGEPYSLMAVSQFLEHGDFKHISKIDKHLWKYTDVNLSQLTNGPYNIYVYYDEVLPQGSKVNLTFWFVDNTGNFVSAKKEHSNLKAIFDFNMKLQEFHSHFLSSQILQANTIYYNGVFGIPAKNKY